jgi:hypothetical protein
MKIQKSIIEIIIVISLILCIVKSLEGRLPNPYYDPNAIPDRVDTTTPQQLIDGWYIPESVIKFKVSLPDGTIIEIEDVDGGENNPDVLYRINGYTVIDEDDPHCWYWARQAEDGTLESTGYPVHLYDPEELGLEKNIKMSKEAAEKERDRLKELYRNG